MNRLLSSVGIMWFKITAPRGQGQRDRGRERVVVVGGYPKRVGVKNLIALISVLAAHPFS